MRENSPEQVKALLFAVKTPDISDADMADSLRELEDLTVSVGCRVVGRLVQNRQRIHPGSFMGSGKLVDARATLEGHGADVAVFDNDLSPSQGDNLERGLGVMVLDRTQLILEIFSRNARTHEARIQVELAQLEYMLPRLVGMWAHLDRERGGIAGSKGAGEKQIDIDRSLIRSRIARLKKELGHVGRERQTQKKGRADCRRVSLVGYTNAGKSTLMNRLTCADVKVEDRLFATLDSTTRVITREQKPAILLSDTVGFIKRLPHGLVASFRSTLEVALDAELLLQVIDAGDGRFEDQMATTDKVLEEIGAHATPRLLVFNKMDRIGERLTPALLRKKYPEAVLLSAKGGDCSPLLERIHQFFEKSMITSPMLLEYAECGALAGIYQLGRVDELRYEKDGIHLKVTATPANLERIKASVAQST